MQGVKTLSNTVHMKKVSQYFGVSIHTQNGNEKGQDHLDGQMSIWPCFIICMNLNEMQQKKEAFSGFFFITCIIEI